MKTEKQQPICQKLGQLASAPFDLTQGLTADRISQFTAEAAGWKLLYGTERITEETLQLLSDFAKEKQAVQRLEKMQRGEKMNLFEGRPALHTALRDFFEPPLQKEATELARGELEKLKSFASNTAFTDLVMVAIGGSELGPEAQYWALEVQKTKGRNVHFVANIDPDNMAVVFDELDLDKTCVVVVSKSGTTLETKTNEAFARSFFEKNGIDSRKHFFAVTTPGTPMDDTGRYAQVFYMWDWVGGRFSASSMGGGVMLSWAFGIEAYMEFLRGAHTADRAALEPDPRKNVPLLMALLGIWNRNFLNYPTLAIIAYSHALRRFAAHLQQVEMESNGKRVKLTKEPVHFRTSPVVWGEPGTCAQHSFFQMLHQGTDVVPLEFIGFAESQWGEDFLEDGTNSQQKLLSNLFAQSIALATGKTNEDPNKTFPGNRPSRILLAKKLTPFSLGALFAIYEHKVAFQGFIWEINSFDQEGVQLGKKLADQMIDRFASRGNAYPLGEAYINQLKTL